MSKQFNYEASRNERKACKAPGCNRMRYRVSSCCRKHTAALYQYGHPEGRHIRPAEYAVERQEVSAFLDDNFEHPATVAAVTFIEQWMDAACCNGPKTLAAKPMQQFKQHGVTGLQILKAAGALWVFAQRNHKRLQDDMRLTYALALACLRLVPRERHITRYTGPQQSAASCGKWAYRRHAGKDRRELGTQLRLKLAPFFVNLNEALNSRELERRQALSDLRRPFTTDLQIPR